MKRPGTTAWHYTNADAARRVDPTRTLTLRRAYEREIRVRFGRLMRGIREYLERWKTPSGPTVVNAFSYDAGKIDEFLDWLQKAQSQELLGVEYGTPMSTAAQRSWQNVYIRAAYQSGVNNASSSLREAGVTVEPSWVESSFSRPIHADRVGMIYTRNFMELSGVTEAMSARMSATLAQGVVDGVGARELTRRLARDVGISAQRAQVIARTEVIQTHAQATLNALQDAGAEEVEPEVEFSSSRDNRVCQRCQSLEGKRFKIAEAQGIIPVHPNCRCNWRVVPVGLEGIVLR